MRPDPFDEHNLTMIVDSCNQSVIVPLDVENNTIAADDA
jgi:hypothetical protein